MSYGYGVSVSLLQLARAYTIFATEGRLLPLTLLTRDGHNPVGESVISAATANTLRLVLERVTQHGGTATKARVAGYRVAGKTGTTRK